MIRRFPVAIATTILAPSLTASGSMLGDGSSAKSPNNSRLHSQEIR